MDELVYFSVSFNCIPLEVADELRGMLLAMKNLGERSFTYSNPIILMED